MLAESVLHELALPVCHTRSFAPLVGKLVTYETTSYEYNYKKKSKVASKVKKCVRTTPLPQLDCEVRGMHTENKTEN